VDMQVAPTIGGEKRNHATSEDREDGEHGVCC
jgi:hypothetical protein